MAKNFQEKNKERIEKIDKVKSIWDGLGDDDPTKEQAEEIKTLNKEIEELEQGIAESKQYQEMREKANAQSAALDKPNRTVPFPGGNGNGVEAKDIKTVGAQFSEFKEFQEWFKTLAPHGEIPESMRVGQSPAMAFKALLTGASATSAGALVQRDYAALVNPNFRPLMLRDIITVGTTGSDLIEYPRMVSRTNNAAPVAEATASSGASGAKPESDMELEKVTTSVKNIAHWIAATKRALADAGQLRTLVDSFLEQGLEEELEDQIIQGDGTGENFRGITNVSGITEQPFVTNILTTTRKARTKVKTVGRAQATGYLLHPNDWETIDLLQDNEGRYFFGGPSVLGNARLWGLPVIESEASVEGFGWCADFRQIILWDREQATIRVSDSHSDFFTRNLVAILAEVRAALGVRIPAALVRMDLTA